MATLKPKSQVISDFWWLKVRFWNPTFQPNFAPPRMAQVDVVNVEATGPDVVPNENQSCIDLAALKEKKPGVIRAKYENSRN